MASELTASTGPLRARRYWRALGQVLAWAVVIGLAWLVWPSSFGGSTSMVVVSGTSMEPTYDSGDLVIARDVPATVGDVIVYAPAALDGSQVVHRIIGGDAESGWRVQGDNNGFVDPFYPTAAEVTGVVQLHVPNAGTATMWLLSPVLWCAVIFVAIVMAVWAMLDDASDDSDDSDRERAEAAEDRPASAHLMHTARRRDAGVHA